MRNIVKAPYLLAQSIEAALRWTAVIDRV